MNAERVGSLVWLMFGAAAIYGALDLGIGTMGAPGSGFLTCVAGSFVALMALLIFIQSFKGDPAAQTRVADLWAGCNWWRAVAISILIILFILAFETLGFFLCSFILLLVIMRWLEGLSWKTSILVPVIAIGCTYLLFKTILKISLPAGIFGF
ncbi:MAG: tripartite tricarboxylate transporter TctB family protein [Candidatus Methylopumilus sp.]|nr:tripartite tricarboxylate transporter TctB family protein [Candidatus Methylopumilus sp.]